MIEIRQHFKPFSLLPGVKLLIPGSRLYAKTYPTKISIFKDDHNLLKEFDFSVQGPLKHFSVFQDLHRGGLSIFSEKYKYFISPEGEISQSPKVLPLANNYSNTTLSLGVHKQSDWLMMHKRKDLREILPFWFRLAAMLPIINSTTVKEMKGSRSLLLKLDHLVSSRRKTEVYNALRELYLAGYSEYMIPQLYDRGCQGIIFDQGEEDSIDLALLGDCVPILQKIFVCWEEGNVLRLLPSLPPEFACGRFININLPIGTLSIEWSKKKIRQVELQAAMDIDLSVRSGGNFQYCRYRSSDNRNYRRSLSKTYSIGSQLTISAGKFYCLDCFSN